MRLALVTQQYPDRPGAPTGGVGAAVAELVPALLAARPDLDLHLVHHGAPQVVEGRRDPALGYTYWGVAGSRLSTYAPWGGFLHREVLPTLLRIAPDVVHAQDSPHFSDPARFPSVLTVHGIAERDTYYRAQRFRALRSALVRRREQPARARFRHVVAIAGYVQHLLGDLGRGRLHFVPNCADATFFDADHSPAGTEPVILQVGVIIPRKNPHSTIEAVGLLKRAGVACRLRLAGPKPTGAYAALLADLVARYDIADRVEFLGSVPHADLAGELRRARVLCLPSFQETAPISIAEANAMGVPAVVAPAGGCAEMVMPGYSGALVDASSPASVAAGLRAYLEDPGLAERHGRRAREMAERYRPASVAAATLRVYEEAIADFAAVRASGATDGPRATSLPPS